MAEEVAIEGEFIANTLALETGAELSVSAP